MDGKPTVALAGTLDTKGVEYKFVKDAIIAAGVDVIMIDLSVIGTPSFEPEISASYVAAAAGLKLEDLRTGKEGADGRTRANITMSKGLTSILKSLVSSGKVDAVLGMGGTGGTDMLSAAMRELPIGFPKLIVSTMASNNTRPYVGNSDMIMMNAVTDIAGLNRISKMVLMNAAHAACGMARDYVSTKKQAEASNPLVAITMWGVTTPGVMRVRKNLEENGFEVVIFHAVGEGAGMEELISKGVINAVIDYSLPELTNNKLQGIFDAGPNRMDAAMKTGIPQVVVPGALECFNFGAEATIPEKYKSRKYLVHNPNITSLLALPEEMTELGKYVADHANNAAGPAAVAFPLKGLDNYMKPGSPFQDIDVSPIFNSIRENLDSDVELLELDYHINDPEFADSVFALFLKQWKARAK